MPTRPRPGLLCARANRPEATVRPTAPTYARPCLPTPPPNRWRRRSPPLVYQLAKLQVFQPYWSCGGHSHPDGTIWKTPRVWFYCADIVHARALADCLLDTKVRKFLKCRWQIALTYCEPGNTGAAFAIEPSPAETVPLADLQSDARRLADILSDAMARQLDIIEAAASPA